MTTVVPAASKAVEFPVKAISTELTVSDHVSERDWEGYVQRHPDATADHRWGWRRVIERALQHQCVYLAASRDGCVSGVLPLVLFRSRLFGRSVVSLPFLNYGGILASDAASSDALLKRAAMIAEDFRATHVELRHRQRQRPELPARSHKLQLRRPLPALTSQLWETVDRKVRNQVRKAQKEGLTATNGGAELLEDYYHVFSRNMRDLGTPVYSKRVFEETLREFPGDARVFVIRHGTTPVGASVTIRFRDTMLVPWASSLKEYRTQCANMLLYWAMMEHAVETGVRTFDFGRSSPDSGPHHFKIQWGAEGAEMAWEYVLLRRAAPPDTGPSNPQFARVVSTWKALPLWLTNALGPSIVRNIP